MSRPTPDPTVPLWHVHVPAAAVAATAIVVMVTASVVAWPEMAAEIVTREADGRHGRSVVNREVSAVMLPAVLAALGVLFAVLPGLEHRLGGLTPVLQEGSPERVRRVLGWTLGGLAFVLTVVHLGVLAMHTGRDFPFEQAVGAAAGLLLAGVGVALPLAAPGGRFSGRRTEAFRAAQGPAYRAAGVLLVLVGVATCVLALVRSPWTLAVSVGGLLLAFGSVIVRAGLAARRAGASGP